MGAHFHDMNQFMNVLREINETAIEALDRLPPTTKLIFRGQHPGHVNCGRFLGKEPLLNYAQPAERDKYSWFLHSSFDKELEAFVKSRNDSRISYWSTYPMYLRPDAHSYASKADDCLHYALPGPMNIEANIFITKLFNKEL